MVINLAFLLLITAVVIRTVAFGLYCLRKKRVAGGISVFFISAAALATGVIVLFRDVL